MAIIDKRIRFRLSRTAENDIRSRPYQFGFPESGFGETVYYKNYSALKEDGTRENWHDTVVRVINGVFTIRKWWYWQNKLLWDNNEMHELAHKMAIAMLEMKWLPPGRGLFIMGKDFIYERGSAALYNCSNIKIKNMPEDADWAMGMLMYGSGVGDVIARTEEKFLGADLEADMVKHEVGDSREGWVKSCRMILEAWRDHKPLIEFDYSGVRPEGAPLKSFGGTASGPKPLKKLHEQLNEFCANYFKHQTHFSEQGFIPSPESGKTAEQMHREWVVLGGETVRRYNWTRFIADVCNAIGVAVIAGSTRRSAEIITGEIHDETFLNLKNLDEFPERQEIYWMSNNSVRLWDKEDFLRLPEIAEMVKERGEPGIVNMVNIRKYGRYGELMPDKAIGTNPCGEIPLESYEVCNIAEVFPTHCNSKQEFMDALHYATFYCSTVSLLPTHDERTNAVVARNRRIGVSLTGIAQWTETWGMAQCIAWMRKGYKHVRALNKKYNNDAGVPPSIRVTTVKPSGSVSQVAGVSSGVHWPTFKYATRRMQIQKSNPIRKKLIESGLKWESMAEFVTEEKAKKREAFPKYQEFAGEGMVAVHSETFDVFEFPVHLGKARAASGVSAWEQFSMLATLQREWADNSVSITVSFNKSEESQLPYMLAQFAPVIKTVSLLPYNTNSYPQMPYEGITKDEYDGRIEELKPINWGKLNGGEAEGDASAFCESDKCEIT